MKVPAGGCTFLILALGEGTKLQTGGHACHREDAEVSRIAAKAAHIAGALDNAQEVRLRATEPLAPAKVDRELPSALGGNMATYVWTINDMPYPNCNSLDVKKGGHVESWEPDALIALVRFCGGRRPAFEPDGPPYSGPREVKNFHHTSCHS